jgi:hypothetical protein
LFDDLYIPAPRALKLKTLLWIFCFLPLLLTDTSQTAQTIQDKYHPPLKCAALEQKDSSPGQLLVHAQMGIHEKSKYSNNCLPVGGAEEEGCC